MRPIILAAILATFALPVYAQDGAQAEKPISVRDHHLAKVCLNRQTEPRFSDYPAEPKDIRVGKLDVAPDAYFKEKDAVESAVGQKPNFAGRYYLAQFGCGTMCMTSVLIEAETGARTAGVGGALGLEFYPNSRLVKVDMWDADNKEAAEDYWEQQNFMPGSVIPEFYILESGRFWRLETPCDKTREEPAASK